MWPQIATGFFLLNVSLCNYEFSAINICAWNQNQPCLFLLHILSQQFISICYFKENKLVFVIEMHAKLAPPLNGDSPSITSHLETAFKLWKTKSYIFFFSYWISFCTLKYVTLWKWNWLHVKSNIKFWPNVYCEVQTVEHGVSNTWYFINEAREEHGQITVSIQSAREKAYIYMPNSIMFCYSFLHPSTTPTPYYQLVPIPARDTRGVLWVWAKFWA